MTYHHLTIDELTMIANFHDQGVKAYRVYRFLATGQSINAYYQRYRKNKARCG